MDSGSDCRDREDRIARLVNDAASCGLTDSGMLEVIGDYFQDLGERDLSDSDDSDGDELDSSSEDELPINHEAMVSVLFK